MCSESCDLFKFWNVSDIISETVQDRDIVAMADQQEITHDLSNGTIANGLQ